MDGKQKQMYYWSFQKIHAKLVSMVQSVFLTIRDLYELPRLFNPANDMLSVVYTPVSNQLQRNVTTHQGDADRNNCD